MKQFISFTNDQPLTYAFEHQEYRNKAREKAFGTPVYFVPSTNTLDEVGCGGAYYKYGYPSVKGQGRLGNCTWYVIARLQETTGQIHKELVGNANLFFNKYKGRKDNEGYIGNLIQKGDVLVYADSDVGHVNFVEDIIGDKIIISESAYSNNKLYEDKTCIVYEIDKSKFVCGQKITLRPKSPYTETLIGVIHTGDVFDKEKVDYQKLYENTIKELQQVKKTIDKILEK